MKNYKIKLQMLSPVHIGSGEEVAPFEYIVKGDYFYRLNLHSFLPNLPLNLRSRFDSAVNSGNIVSIRNFILENIDHTKHTLFKAFAHDSFIQAYEKNLSNPSNQLLVNLAMRRGGDFQSYIPGSSIKGSIRTAVISTIGESHVLRDKFKSEKEILKYNDAKQDPFRCIKIVDAALPDDVMYIDNSYQIGFKGKKQGPQMFYEQTYSMLDEEDVFAQSELRIDDELPAKTYNDKKFGLQKAVSRPLTMDDILFSCNEFYQKKLEDEFENFYKKDANAAVVEPLVKHSFKDNECLLRIGRFSHAECVTLDKHRDPAAPKGFGKTRTTSNGVPFGWVKMIVCQA